MNMFCPFLTSFASFGVVDVDSVLAALFFLKEERKFAVGLHRDLAVARQLSCAYLRPLRVEQHGYRRLELLLDRADVLERPQMRFVSPWLKFEPRDVHFPPSRARRACRSPSRPGRWCILSFTLRLILSIPLLYLCAFSYFSCFRFQSRRMRSAPLRGRVSSSRRCAP